jgi:hypothetical protein
MKETLKALLKEYPYISVTLTELSKMSDIKWKKLIQIDSRFYSIQNDIRMRKINKK